MAASTAGGLADWWDGLQQHLLDQGNTLVLVVKLQHRQEELPPPDQ